MAQPDAFALKNSGLNEFLFAEIGDETNGSSLTLLSMLARLGKDPWAEAARWATLPTAALTQILIDSMARMPLTAQALRDAPGTAARLIGLLPQRRATGQPGQLVVAQKAAEGLGWLPLAFILTALAMGVVFNLANAPAPANPPAAAAPIDPAVSVPKAG